MSPDFIVAFGWDCMLKWIVQYFDSDKSEFVTEDYLYYLYKTVKEWIYRTESL